MDWLNFSEFFFLANKSFFSFILISFSLLNVKLILKILRILIKIQMVWMQKKKKTENRGQMVCFFHLKRESFFTRDLVSFVSLIWNEKLQDHADSREIHLKWGDSHREIRRNGLIRYTNKYILLSINMLQLVLLSAAERDVCVCVLQQ